MRIPLRSLPIRAGYPSIYENGAPAGGVSPRRALSFLCRRFLSENAAAIESRAYRVLSSSSGRALPPPVARRRPPYRRSAHSRDQRCPANYYTLINRTRARPRFDLFFPPSFSRLLPISSTLFPSSARPRPYPVLRQPLSPPSYRYIPISHPFRARYAPRAYGLTVRECHGSDRFSRPRSVDAASGERRTGVDR